MLITENLCRTAPFAVRGDTVTGDGYTLDGYGAVFDSPTVINSWEGRFEETIVPGAFKKSLRERTPRLQFDHGTHPLIGSIPIGTITEATEDDRGLHIVGRLSDNWLVAPVRDAIASGAVDGMSFRFTVIRDEWVDAGGRKLKPAEVETAIYASGDTGDLVRRRLLEVKMDEVGPVVWPAYRDTSVAVRSGVIDLSRLHEPEQRELLARAVYLADTATKGDNDLTGAPPNTPTGAARHAPASVAPQPTDPAGEHAKHKGHRPIDMWVRKARDVVLTLN